MSCTDLAHGATRPCYDMSGSDYVKWAGRTGSEAKHKQGVGQPSQRRYITYFRQAMSVQPSLFTRSACGSVLVSGVRGPGPRPCRKLSRGLEWSRIQDSGFRIQGVGFRDRVWGLSGCGLELRFGSNVACDAPGRVAGSGRPF